MAKLQREQRVRERRAAKLEKKQAAAAERAREAAGETPAVDKADGDAAHELPQ